MRLRAQRRDVWPNIAASLRSESGLPLLMLVRQAATAAALTSSAPLSDPSTTLGQHGAAGGHLIRVRGRLAQIADAGLAGPARS